MSVEVRFDDKRQVDEIIATNCTVHLERLGPGHWCLILETPQCSRGHFVLRSKRDARIDATVVEVNMKGAQP